MTMFEYQIYHEMDNEKTSNFKHFKVKNEVVVEEGKEFIISKDDHKRILSSFKIDGNIFCRIVLDPKLNITKVQSTSDQKEKVPAQDKEDQKKKQKQVLQIPEGIQERISISQKSQYLIKEYKMVNLDESICFLQEKYLNNLQQIEYTNLNFGKKLQIIRDIAMALVDLKKHMICHTAISPFWIAITSQSENQISCKLILHEFSLGLEKIKRIEGQRRQKYPTQFTPYTAPEIRNIQKYGIQADVWSLMAVFYQMIFGSLQGIRITPLSISIEFPSQIPNWLKSLFQRSLCFKPSDRFSPKQIVELIKPALLCAETAGKYMPSPELKPKAREK